MHLLRRFHIDALDPLGCRLAHRAADQGDPGTEPGGGSGQGITHLAGAVIG
ncbi:hypothetical protein Q427_05210 [Halomonas sp. BC04]|nr:hypothetical protein Q427_05210 [Halomonas sp. BC04]